MLGEGSIMARCAMTDGTTVLIYMGPGFEDLFIGSERSPFHLPTDSGSERDLYNLFLEGKGSVSNSNR